MCQVSGVLLQPPHEGSEGKVVFCSEVSVNSLSSCLQENIMRHRAMDNDETYYLWCLRFFMEFNRVHDFRVDIVG